jgi:hypothetical protein
MTENKYGMALMLGLSDAGIQHKGHIIPDASTIE